LCSGELAGVVHFIFLDAPHEIIAERLTRRQHAYMNSLLLLSQYETLERPGSDEPVTTISVEGSFEQTVSAIVECVKRLM
jgi:gluconokinase